MTTQRRAKSGGEVGLNGEVYPAGSFICTTTLGKMARTAKAKVRKVQVGPYEWAEEPTPGARPLYIGAVGGVFGGKPLSIVNDTALAYLGITREELASRVERHASGERWE
jgi:hypothetical protein